MTPSFDNGLVQLYQGDARDLPLQDRTVHCVVTSPPYFGLRVYRTDDQRVLGLEKSIEEYIANLVDVFREVKRVLRDDGYLWVNMGDSYWTAHNPGGGTESLETLSGKKEAGAHVLHRGNKTDHPELQPGNLWGVPWRLALALQQDGWILRDAVVWAKASPVPESLAGWRWEQCRVEVGAVPGGGGSSAGWRWEATLREAVGSNPDGPDSSPWIVYPW